MWARGREGSGFQSKLVHTLDGLLSLAYIRTRTDSHHLSVPHDLHRQRRKHLDGFFSRQGINRTEGIVAGAARHLADRLQALEGTGTVIHIDHAFSALTGDVIGHVACGADPGLVKDANFSPEWYMLPRVIANHELTCS